MNRVRIAKRLLYVYIAVIVVFAVLSVYLLIRVYSLDNLYSFKQTFQNISGLCSPNKSANILFYGNNCASCMSELSAFTNVTSAFGGSWIGNKFYGPYFCAYKFNVSQYNIDPSSVQAPAGSIQLFSSLSDRVPMVFIGGIYSQYYKIGGFTSIATAEQQLKTYICRSINDVAPTCAGV
jgi:hypothetical protein